VGESTPDQPNGSKRPEFARAFAASVRQPGERASLAGRAVTAGVVVVLAGAAALGIGALAFHKPGQAKTMNAADASHKSPNVRTSPPSPIPTRTVTQGPAPVAMPPAAAKTPQQGKHGKSAKVSPHSTAPPASARAQTLHAAAATAAHSIVGSASGRCIDVTGRRATDGNPLQIWRCLNIPGQKWTFYKDGTLRSMGLCMDVAWGSHDDGAVIQLANCHGGPAQHFYFSSAGDLVNAGADKCVDVKDKGTANGTSLQLWQCTGGSNQKWSLG
jgi:hypothetical protein